MSDEETMIEVTAYALGELEGADEARVAARVAADPALLREVEEIRRTAALLEGELAEEVAAEPEVEAPVVRRRSLAP